MTDKIFGLANTEYVLVLDCHVLLDPGSLKKLLDFYDAGKDHQNLLQGPLIYDDNSEDKNKATLATSIFSAYLFKEILFLNWSIISLDVFSYIISVFVNPGAIAFTLILCLPNSLERVLAWEIIAAFEAE